MTDENNISKLGDKLGDSNVRQTRRSLKFTDYAIDRYNADFINAKGKTQKQVRISFDVSKNTALKGLRLVHYRNSKKKYFNLQYWFNGRPNNVSIGEFRLGIFGVKEVEEKVFNLVKQFTNDKGHWTSDPRLAILEKEHRITKALIQKSQQLTIRDVILRIAKDGFPKTKRQGYSP